MDERVKEIIYQLGRHQFEPMDAIMDTKNNMFMEWITGTTKFVSHLKKVIYDLTFADVYYHDRKVPKGHIAMGEYLYRIEESATFDNPDKYLEILNKPSVGNVGTKFLLDGVLYMDNVSFIRAEKIRDNLLQQRRECTKLFNCLSIVDPSGNATQFLASPAVQKRMEEYKAVHNV